MSNAERIMKAYEQCYINILTDVLKLMMKEEDRRNAEKAEEEKN